MRRNLRSLLNSRSSVGQTVGKVTAKDGVMFTVETSSKRKIKVSGSKEYNVNDRVVVAASVIIGKADNIREVREFLI